MGIFEDYKAKSYKKYSTDPSNFSYGKQKVWNELSPIEKASSLFQKYAAGAGEMAVGMGKAVAETGAAIADTAIRTSPLEGLRNVASGVSEAINPERPGSSALQSFQKGVAESQARPLLTEKLTGKQLQNPDGTVNWDFARKFVGRAAEAPTYLYAGAVKGAELVGKGLLSRILARSIKTLPEAGINTALQAGEEGTTENVGRNFLMNALLMSGVSNVAGEIKFPKEVLNDTLSKVEKEIGTITPEQKIDIKLSLEQGIKPDEIVTNLRKVVSNEVTPDEVAEVLNKQVEKQVSPKVETPEVKTETPTTKDPLIQEARKIYRGGSTFEPKKMTSEGASFTTNKEIAERFNKMSKVKGGTGKLEEMVLSPNAKVLNMGDVPSGLKNSEVDIVEYARKNGYDAVDFGKQFGGRLEDEIRIINPKVVSQPLQEGVGATAPKTEVPTMGKTPGVAKAAHDINVSFAKKGLEVLPEEDLARYTPITKEKVGERIATVMDDWENAKNIALMKGDLPEGIPPTAFFESVVAKAEKEGDIQLMRELASSPMASKSSEAGQQLGATGWFKENQSVVSTIKDVSDVRTKAVEKRLKTGDIKKTQDLGREIIQKEIKKFAPTKENWNSFISSITCK